MKTGLKSTCAAVRLGCVLLASAMLFVACSHPDARRGQGSKGSNEVLVWEDDLPGNSQGWMSYVNVPEPQWTAVEESAPGFPGGSICIKRLLRETARDRERNRSAGGWRSSRSGRAVAYVVVLLSNPRDELAHFPFASWKNPDRGHITLISIACSRTDDPSSTVIETRLTRTWMDRISIPACGIEALRLPFYEPETPGFYDVTVEFGKGLWIPTGMILQPDDKYRLVRGRAVARGVLFD